MTWATPTGRFTPAHVVEAGSGPSIAGRGRGAVDRAAGWIPELSALDF